MMITLSPDPSGFETQTPKKPSIKPILSFYGFMEKRKQELAKQNVTFDCADLHDLKQEYQEYRQKIISSL